MKILIVTLIIIINQFVFAQSIGSLYPLQKLEIGNFITDKNDTIKNCFLTYRIFGKVNSDSSNIIFFPTWLAGNSENIGTLISKYSFLDTNKFLIISIDALGNGYSASPSNYSNFPEITFNDMTRAYHYALSEKLRLKNLYAIVGGSMGGMTAFEFAVKHPNYAKKIVSYVSSPLLTSYDLLWTSFQIDFIQYLLSINADRKKIKAFSDMIVALISRTPTYLNRTISVEEFENYFNKFYKEPDSIYTLENYLCQLKSITSYNISKEFNNKLEEAAKSVKSKMLIIVSESDMMVNSQNAIKFSEMIKSEVVVLKNDCGHLAVNCEMDRVREIINNFLIEN